MTDFRWSGSRPPPHPIHTLTAFFPTMHALRLTPAPSARLIRPVPTSCAGRVSPVRPARRAAAASAPTPAPSTTAPAPAPAQPPRFDAHKLLRPAAALALGIALAAAAPAGAALAKAACCKGAAAAAAPGLDVAGAAKSMCLFVYVCAVVKSRHRIDSFSHLFFPRPPQPSSPLSSTSTNTWAPSSPATAPPRTPSCLPSCLLRRGLC